ncbi:hypothetical protein CKO15_13355 [Halorhodospira abdelmalekii]|uniref:hypothetical protein n=1 Tax=Halorhodospira abdelmalekii TaxID=421629 RepID=UPI0019083794|nr:hypothetical protein [Halorhodospira abdelmalekii]MBK1736231.1 hypothetical protein [Halorhodospira abdelmalekii]
MSTFAIDTSDGVIPADRIIRTLRPRGCHTTMVEYQGGDGQPAKTQASVPISLVDYLPVIPSTPGYEVVELFPDEDAIDGLGIERIPIVAWRIDGQSALPVIPLDTLHGDDQAILTPSGAVFARDQWFADLAAYRRFHSG